MSLFIKSFRNLRWYEWAMFAAMVLIGGFYMLLCHILPRIMNHSCMATVKTAYRHFLPLAG